MSMETVMEKAMLNYGLNVCDNDSMSVYPHDCDDMLLESLGIVDIPNDKLFKKNAKKL